MKKELLTAMELIEIAEQMEMTHFKSIDNFLCNKFGIDFDRLPFYKELKSKLDQLMERIIIDNNINWSMKDF